MKTKSASALFLLIIFYSNLSAQHSFDKTKLDDYLSLLNENNKAMMGVVFAHDDTVDYKNYIGFASVQDGIENSETTKFRIGSITKMFTAAMIFQLIDEKKLTLETKLADFYPQILNSKKITISDLLRHRSGIHNITSDPDYSQYMSLGKSKDEMLKLIAALKPDFMPNEKTAYSNSNYILLGYIIEDVTNSTYKQELEKRIAGKLKLVDTYYGSKINVQQNEAASYKFEKDTWKIQPETDMSIPHGAGAVVSTAKDLTTFISALFNRQLITESSLKQMMKIKDGLGRGLMRFPFYDKTAYGHNGGIDGFVANAAYFPDENVAVAVTANGMNTNFNDILIGILSIYFNIPYEMPDFSAKEIQLSVEELEKYVGEFSSQQLPLKITLKVDGGVLYGQATGQAAFPLTAFSASEFHFEQAGLVIKFSTDDAGTILYNAFELNQGGGKFHYEKQ